MREAVVDIGNKYASNMVTNPTTRVVTSGGTKFRFNLYNGSGFPTPTISAQGALWTRVGQNVQYRARANPSDLIPNAMYTCSVEVYNDTSTTSNLTIDWCDNGVVSAEISPGERRIVSTTTSRGGYDSVYSFFDLAASGGASGLLVRNVMIEQSNQLRPFFDGSTASADGWAYGWNGTAGSSTSYASASTTTIRTNLSNNPGSEVSALNVVGSGQGTVTRDTTRFLTGTASSKFVWSSGDRGAELGSISKDAGRTVTFSAYVYSESGALPVFSMQANDYSGVAGTTGVYAPTSAGSWQRIWITGVVPSGKTGLRVYNLSNSAATYYIDCVLIEDGPLREYFDGSSPNADDFITGWAGTAGASASVMQGVTPFGYFSANSITNETAVWSAWRPDGSRAIGTMPKGELYDQAVGLSSTGLGFGVLPLGTYTLLARATVPATLTGGTESFSRVRRITYRDDTIGWPGVYSTQFPVDPGVYDISFTFTVKNTAGQFLRLYTGHNFDNGGNQVFWSNIMLTSGTYTGSYVDGDTSGWSWSGIPGASPSSGPVLPPYFGPDPNTLATSLPGNQAGVILRTDSRVPNMQFARAMQLGAFDSRLHWSLGAVPYSTGTQDWVFEGWLCAVDVLAYGNNNVAVTVPGLNGFRYGTGYGNSGGNGITSAVVLSSTVITRSAFLNVWRPFRMVIRHTVPPDAILGGAFTPNSSGHGWLLAGARYRRAMPGEVA